MPHTPVMAEFAARAKTRLPVPHPTSSTHPVSTPAKSMNSGASRRLQRPICRS
jgi:hypothetical protein